MDQEEYRKLCLYIDSYHLKYGGPGIITLYWYRNTFLAYERNHMQLYAFYCNASDDYTATRSKKITDPEIRRLVLNFRRNKK